jgi:uncharacterized protein (UPF0128 family)
MLHNGRINGRAEGTSQRGTSDVERWVGRGMIYTRCNYRVFFVLPTIALGFDIDDAIFVEAAWFFFVIGFK